LVSASPSLKYRAAKTTKGLRLLPLPNFPPLVVAALWQKNLSRSNAVFLAMIRERAQENGAADSRVKLGKAMKARHCTLRVAELKRIAIPRPAGNALAMTMYETFTHDVLVIGAVARGCALRSKPRRRGLRLDGLQISLLGKAHTVMAEAVSRRRSHVDDRDNWKVHFADTMRGGQYVNQWRMAETAREGSARSCPRTRENGARSSIAQKMAAFCSGILEPQISTPCACRRSHWTRNDPDFAGSRIHQGIEVYMEHTILVLLKDGDRVVGAFGSSANAPLRIFARKQSCLRPAELVETTKSRSNSWESTGDGLALAYEAGAELIDMEFVQFHPRA